MNWTAFAPRGGFFDISAQVGQSPFLSRYHCLSFFNDMATEAVYNITCAMTGIITRLARINPSELPPSLGPERATAEIYAWHGEKAPGALMFVEATTS